MKKISIKTMITLWYTILILLIVGFVFAFISFFSTIYLEQNTRDRLTTSVESAATYIEYKSGIIKIDNKLETLYDDVDISVYDSYGNLLYGGVPRTFNMDTSFYQGVNTALTPDGDRYFYFDKLTSIDGYGSLWLRGVTSYSGTQETLRGIMIVSVIALPAFALFVLIGGYFITKKAMKPIDEITRSAEEISAGEDLNKRLNMEEGSDEIYHLAQTFDLMFNRLEKSFEREKQFTSDLSHELRTPTSIITLGAQSLIKSPNLNENDRKLVESILFQTSNMTYTISQMLLIARAEKGQVELELENIDLLELVTILKEEQENSAKDKGITINISIPSGVKVKADRGLLIRILMNLITNAIDYGIRDGYINISLKEEENYRLLTVEDNGIDISKENIDKIWDRLYQVDLSRSKNKTITAGLGLPIVKWLATLHGWSTAVESQPNKGTSFIIKIPKD